MVKVCHMSSVHLMFDGRIFHRECCSLAKAGYETFLVIQGQSQIKCGVNIVGIDAAPSNRIKRILFTARKVYKTALAIDADIYHFHDPELLPWGLKLKRKGKKVIFDSHEDYSEQIKTKQWIPRCLRNLIGILYRNYETYVCKRLDAVIIPCTMEGKNFFDQRCRLTVIVGNAPSVEFSNEIALIKNKLFPNQGIKACYVGSLTYARGVSFFVKAAAKAGVSVILAGEFSPPQFYDEVKDTNEWKSVKYYGEIPREEIYHILAEADIGVSTLLNIGQYNKGDTFATKVYEYMAAGLPIVISMSSYVEKNLVKKYNCAITVTPDDINELTKALEYLKNNPEIAQAMGERAKKAFLTEFNWSTEENRLLELYKRIVENER
ncbi:MAG: glycosyltransferase [Peptococcaceae bacterium]|nr:glycosyltransferase [Peptococcaceae bacterium]